MRPIFFVGIALVACAESPPPPSAPVSLDVPPLPPPKPSASEPAARPPAPVATPIAADDDDETPRPRDTAAAEVAFQDAKRAMAAGDYAKARALFRESLRFDRAAGTLLNLALCEEKLGDRTGAIKHYLAAEAEATKNGQRDRAAFARERAAALMAGP